MAKVTSQNRATSSSKRLRALSTKSSSKGRIVLEAVLGSRQIQESIARANADRRLKQGKFDCSSDYSYKATHWQIASVHLSPSDIPEDERVQPDIDASYAPPNENDLNAVLDGAATYDLSHAGGEFEHIVEDLIQQTKQKDERTRRDRVQNRIEAFKLQMDGIMNAYLDWAARMGDDAFEAKPISPEGRFVEGAFKLRVMDVFLSIAFDLYLDIHAETASRVEAALGCNLPKWRLKNACPACTYKLQNETNLIFKMLFTMDRNDSLKRLRCASKPPSIEEGSEPHLGESKAREDLQTVPGDRYLTQEEVDSWAKANLEELLLPGAQKEASDDEESPCIGRWTNMINEVTAKMWGIFDETGVFLMLCRHSFSLVIADMVASGELSKYPLAVVDILLDAFGNDLGVGYDIGCRFKTTVGKSDLGARARELRFKALVGSFHGHVHNCICQLSNLATYVKGMGLEDLEGCERFFSKSNALTASTRYASTFHRCQKIVQYMAHTDAFETSHNLSTFLVKNYEQALDLLAGEDAL
ncbi:hypothetical protein C0992_000998 [Termitomyces sp. T32_za158]|nr:hypothetical protein C0992_000998 [Termitomyces sp. T32_za158]